MTQRNTFNLPTVPITQDVTTRILRSLYGSHWDSRSLSGVGHPGFAQTAITTNVVGFRTAILGKKSV